MQIKTREIRNFNVQLISRSRVADNTFKAEFHLVDGEILFEAGQYIWLKIPKLSYPDPRGNRRAFSIVSDPQKRDSITIITRKSESGFKKTLLELPIGSTLEIIGPFGSFTFSKDRPGSPVYFIAGGTGVSCFLSMIESRAHSDSGPPISLIYSENTKEDFLPEALALQKSDKYKSFLKVFPNTGKITWGFIKKSVEINHGALWYFSGPQKMVEQLSLTALKNGVAKNQMIFEESYPHFTSENTIGSLNYDFYKLAVENSLVHTVITDINGRILYANKASTNITGYSLEEMLGNTPRLWGGLMDREFYKNLWHTIKIDRKPFVEKIRNRRKNNEYYTAELSIAPIISQKNGNLLGFTVSENDITKLEQLDQEKTDFITITSHQLRTPLTGIRWVAERLLEDQNIPRQELEYLADIYKSTIRLSGLVESLLNMSRIESGAVNINPERLDIVELLNGCFKECNLLLKEKSLVFDFNTSLNKLEAVIDKAVFQDIVQSILYNSIEYTPEKGEIKVTLEKKKDAFLITVKDTGIGIPLEEQSKVFSKFFRASNAKSIKAGGTGIGLYIVSESSKLLGGRVWFESQTNKGTAFYVELPLILSTRKKQDNYFT